MITKPLENYMGSVIKVRNNYAYYLEFDRIQNSSGLVTSLVFKFGFFTIPKFFEYRLFRFEKTDLLNHTPALVGNGSTMFLSISIKIFINVTNCFHIKMALCSSFFQTVKISSKIEFSNFLVNYSSNES